MAHLDVALPTIAAPTTNTPKKKPPFYVKILASVLVIALGGFIVVFGQMLYQDWVALQKDEAAAQRAGFVGYIEIGPQVSYARPPSDWIRSEPAAHLLWACWNEGKHEWFSFPPGHLDGKQLSRPEGRDFNRAIDIPIIEVRGGERWNRVPAEARIAGLEIKGGHIAIPHLVLERVRIVNHEVDGTPLVVIWRPFVAPDQAANSYESAIDGKRLSFGSSGYYNTAHTPHRALLYDRGTTSLWMEEADTLTAIAGAYKGSSLKRVQALASVPWSAWRALHPKSGLVVGADRTQGQPKL